MGAFAGQKREPYGVLKTITYALQGMNVVDFLAILPFYMALSSDIGEQKLIFLRLLRLVRVIRIFKLGRVCVCVCVCVYVRVFVCAWLIFS